MENNFEIVNKFVERKNLNEEKMIACVERFINQSESIGEGENAEVFALDDHEFSNLCAKRIKKRPKISANTVAQEADLQKRIHEAGVKTPLILYALESDDTKVIVMERVFGSTVGEVINGQEEPPEDFDTDTFFKTLNTSIQRMHEANVYHRDLHSDNVMINQNGEPVIIDFGVSTMDFDEQAAYREPAYVRDERTGRYREVTGYYSDDFVKAKDMRIRMKQLDQLTKK